MIKKNIVSPKTKIVRLVPVGKKNQLQQLAEEDYHVISERILCLSKKQKSVLFAGSGSGALPITIPVNIAIQLAEKGKNCLLIDLDLRRDAIAQVFEISNEQINQHLMPRAIKTNFQNLLIFPASHFIRTRLMNVAKVVDAAVEKMDIVLINAPAIRTSPDRGQILAAAQLCCLFSKDTAESEEMLRLARGSASVLIGNVQIITDPGQHSSDSAAPVDLPKTTV